MVNNNIFKSFKIKLFDFYREKLPVNLAVMEAASFIVSSYDEARKIERTARLMVGDHKKGDAFYYKSGAKKSRFK